MDAPSVAVILVNYNGLADTRECVASLRAGTYPHVKLYIVDNASPNGDGPRVQAEFGATATVLELKENLGFAGGNNRAIERALADGADYVCLLNNDTIVTPGWLEPLVAQASQSPAVNVVGGKIFFAGARERIWFGSGWINRWTAEFKLGRPSDYTDVAPRQCQMVSGCLQLAHRSAWERAGLLDESFFMYHEDVEWCLRAGDRGCEFYYVPASVIYHKVSASSGRMSNFSIYYLFRNHYWLIRKCYPGLRALVARILFWKMFLRIYLGSFRPKNKGSRAIFQFIFTHIRKGVQGKTTGIPQ